MANILVVEDDQDLNAAYKIILEHEGHDVRVAFDGKEALGTVQNSQPEIIVLDLLMPVMSGIEFLREYNNTDHNSKILVFTNLENSSEINEAFRLGADKCVVKSWTGPQGLVKMIDGVLGKSTPASA